MSWRRNTMTTTMAAVVWLLGVVAVTSAYAQASDPEQAPIHLGPLAVAPAVRLWNMGHDDNVFNQSEAERPVGDVMATASPAVEAWVRTPRVRISGKGVYDFFYYRELKDLRMIDTDTSARVELVLNRIMPYVEGSLVNSGHQNGYEIDIFARRHDEGAHAGVEVRLTPKTAFGAYAGKSHSSYDQNSIFNNTDLSVALNHDGTVEGLGARYSLTPLTTLSLFVEQQQDRFQFSADRNSDSLRVLPSVEFKPRALISGRATVGYRKVTFFDSTIPEFKGIVASVNLSYHMRPNTDIGVGVQRDLDYSYIDLQHDYVSTGFFFTATQRFLHSWDARGSIGRYRLGYRQRIVGLGDALPSETNLSLGAEVGYQIRHSRLAFNVDHYQRDSDLAVSRGYERLRVASSISYVF